MLTVGYRPYGRELESDPGALGPGYLNSQCVIYCLEFIRRRPRNTAKPPASIVSPAIAEAGSISGALTGEGEEDGKQTFHQRIW